MFEVTCWDSYNRVITGLTQWDINQTLYLKDVYNDFGLTKAPMFHFCNQRSKEALVVQSTIENDNVIAVKVPNILLQEGIPLIAYMYVYSIPSKQDGSSLTDIVSSASAKTLVAIKLTVKPRVKPSQYKYVENIDSLTVAQIEKEIKDRLDKLETELKNNIDSKLAELENLTLQLEEWLSKSEISTTSAYITSEIHEVITDESRRATLPFTSESYRANFVFINGLFAVEDKDYQITGNNIELINSEFILGNDIVTFVTFKSVVEGKSEDNKTINISSEIYEAQTDAEGYSVLPFTFNNQVFQVFINGLLAVKEKDYSIVDNNSKIKIKNSEFVSGNDIVTFVVLQEIKKEDTNESTNISLETYETITDDAGYAVIPLVPTLINKNYGDSCMQIFINGMFGIVEKDYIIKDNNIQILNTESNNSNDIITFIVFKAITENKDVNTDCLTKHPTINTSDPTNSSSILDWGDKITAYSEVTKDTNGHVTGGKITKYTLPSSEATTSSKGLLSAADKQTINNLPNVYAKKSDVVNVYRYKGSVDTYTNLPNNDLNSGDVYNVEDTGKNYAWTGSAWDDLGGSFEINIQPITKEELDKICV